MAGTVLPALPGAPLVFLGLLLAAWIDGFARVGPVTLAVLGILAALTLAVDVLSTTLGVKKAGASRGALVGAAIGTVVGFFLGLLGVVVGPFVGALIGEFAVRRDWKQAGRAGVATWIGFAVGTAAKIAIVFTMLGVFALAFAFSSLGSGNARIRSSGGSGSDGWEEVRIGTDAVFSGLHFVDPSVGWIVGGGPFVEGGIVGLTADGGSTWRFRTGVAPNSRRRSYSLSAVHGFDRVQACAAGDDGILLTFDGGESWRPANNGRGSHTNLAALHFIDGHEGWASGLNGILHTTDAGMNWTRLGGDSSAGGSIGGRAIHFFDSQNGWLAGLHANLWRTRDGGETWARVPVPLPERPAANPPHFFGMTWVGSQGWVVGEFGTILHTSDSGGSWTLQDAGNREAFLTAVQFLDPKNGWMTGFVPHTGKSFVWHTADAGATWTVQQRWTERNCAPSR